MKTADPTPFDRGFRSIEESKRSCRDAGVLGGRECFQDPEALRRSEELAAAGFHHPASRPPAMAGVGPVLGAVNQFFPTGRSLFPRRLPLHYAEPRPGMGLSL